MELFSLAALILLVYLVYVLRQMNRKIDFLTLNIGLLSRQAEVQLPATVREFLYDLGLDTIMATKVQQALRNRGHDEARQIMKLEAQLSEADIELVVALNRLSNS